MDVRARVLLTNKAFRRCMRTRERSASVTACPRCPGSAMACPPTPRPIPGRARSASAAPGQASRSRSGAAPTTRDTWSVNSVPIHRPWRRGARLPRHCSPLLI